MNHTQNLFGSTMDRLEQALEMRSIRHQILLSNIANVDTPGYKAFDVILKEAVESHKTLQMPDEKSDSGHFSFSHSSAGFQTRLNEFLPTTRSRWPAEGTAIRL